MIGAVLVLLVMVLVGPIAVMFGGAVWTALMGWALADDADARADATDRDAADG